MIDFRNVNCMKLMAEFEDNHFDLAIVDPPYGIGADNFSNGQNLNRSDGWNRSQSSAVKSKNRLNSGSGKLKDRSLNNSDTSWDIAPDRSYFEELFRVSKNQIIWGGNYFDLPPTRGIVCWDKIQPWENFSQFELAWTSFDTTAKMFRKSNTGGANKGTKIHPTQKPIELYTFLLSKFAKEGNKILDTHVGSGSSLIACRQLGFDVVGSELSVDYYNDAQQRIKEETAQMSLF